MSDGRSHRNFYNSVYNSFKTLLYLQYLCLQEHNLLKLKIILQGVKFSG